MTLVLLPFRLLYAGVRIATTLAALAVVAAIIYGVVNYAKAPSDRVYENLQRGTVVVRTAGSEGTGAIVKEGDEWRVITAAHVVGTNSSVEVRGRDGAVQRATVLGVDRQMDVAKLAIKPSEGWVALPIEKGSLKPSDRVLTLCFFDSRPRQGPVLGPVAVNHVGREQVQTQLDVIQLLGVIPGLGDSSGGNVMALMAVQPGCSGAPMLSSSGEMVGIVVAGNSREAIVVTSSRILPKD